CLQRKGESLRQALKDYHAKAESKCYVDVSSHLIISDPLPSVLGQELPALVDDGYTSFEVFMTYQDLALTDIELLEVFSTARETGALAMVHAENYDAIRFLTNRLERAGKTAPRYHTTSRPIPVEREATYRAIRLAGLIDVPILIVHVSNGEAMEEIRRAQSRGLKIYGETCPQYLVLTEKDLEGLNMEGAKYVCSPPPRDLAGQEACWRGLQSGIFHIFSSDPLPVSVWMISPASLCRRAARVSAGCRTASRAARRVCPSCFRRGSRKGESPSTTSSPAPRPNTPKHIVLIPAKVPPRHGPPRI